MQEQEQNITSNEETVVETATEVTETVQDTVSESVETVVEQQTPKKVKVNEPKAAHDDYNWGQGKRAVHYYEQTDRSDWETRYDKTFKTINEHEIIQATIEAVTGTHAVLNIGFKSDGLVPLSEFRHDGELKIGDTVEVYVDEKEDKNGQLRISRNSARDLRAWETIIVAHRDGLVVKGEIISKTKGGLIVRINGIETFLPGSQIDVRPVTDYDAYVGKIMEFKVVKVNDIIKNAVVSHKALIESDIEDQRQRIISQLEKGQVLEGTVKNITDFGAFIDLGGVDGLLYITDISWGRINHPNEVLQLNQKINVVVIDYDEAKRRISLGLKQLTPHPWEVLSEGLEEGSTIKGKVVNIEDYGAFIEIQPGVEGLVHVSEISWSNQPVNPRDVFKVGEECEAKIVTLDRTERKMSLSIKQLQSDPWETIEERYPVGSRHTGEVKNTTPYGVFVELKEGIGGMVHISDLSWTRRFNHPSEYVKSGENLEVIILGIDKEARKLSLGHKQIEEDPWDTFSTVFPIGSEHNGTIIKRDDKGAIISLPYGIEAFAPNKHLRKEDNSMAAQDETLTWRVIEFDRNDKRIIVSHTDWVYAQRNAAEKAKDAAAEKEQAETNKAIETVNQQTNDSKSTMGDLSALADLKKQLDGE
ncbi:MAG: 30S ribosomal protein S1 [Chitinophagales bacterium]|nr:30S ribosomal protein S1 [Chitinophagales bacterium]